MNMFGLRLGLASLAFSVSIGPPQALSQAESCAVSILEPSPDTKVSEVDQVKGTGTIPAWSYLWVFAHREGLAFWWPEGGGPAVITNRTWEVTATFGQERDNGRRFEIAAVVVDRNTHEKLMSWVKKANETNQYPGMSLPPAIEGCKREVIMTTKE